MYIISGRGRKSGVARATGATASLAPMTIYEYMYILHSNGPKVENSAMIYYCLLPE